MNSAEELRWRKGPMIGWVQGLRVGLEHLGVSTVVLGEQIKAL